MGTIHVETAKTIDASPEQVFRLLADYRTTHRDILPSDTYLDYQVDQGGEGAGTVYSYKLKTPMRPEPRPYKMKVSVPASGNVLQESDQNSSLVTTWTLVPEAGGAKTQVRLTTEWESRASGFGGFMERTMAPRSTKRLYDTILDRLENVATGQPPSNAGR